ncbi:MAG: hypothetical protein ABIK89_13750, partial [Planctomycetota bacterium]
LGCNNNSDGFTADTLRKSGKTFMKYARHYHHHRNKNPKPVLDGGDAYGYVKAAFFNEPMSRLEAVIEVDNKLCVEELEKLARDIPVGYSMACFPPGTPVWQHDGTECAIDEVPIGAKVVTHHGNVERVEQVMSRRYDGELVRFRACGLPDDLVCTENHKIWTRPVSRGKPQGCPVCGRKFKNLNAHLWQKRDPQHQLARQDYSRYAENWFPANQLVPGDFVRTPFDTEAAEEGDADWAELLGYYLAEGHTFNYPDDYGVGVDFSFHRDEVEFANRVEELVRSMGHDNVKVYLRKNTVRLVRVTSPELKRRLERDGGRYSWGKQIDARIMRWSPEVQMKLLGAFIDGDGDYNKVHHNLKATTVSRRLAFQLATICWRNGIPARLNDYTPKGPNRRRWYGVVVQREFSGRVPTAKVPEDHEAAGPAAHPLGQLRHQQAGQVAVFKAAKVSTYIYVENGFVYRRVLRTSTEPYSGPVYNIAVEGDSSYVASGVAVSNCKIAFDVCSICNNKATSRHGPGPGKNLTKKMLETPSPGYCDHMKLAAGRHLQDGRQIFVDNPNPVFFDVSYVGDRPADQIAWGLRHIKAASLHGGIVTSAELAERAHLVLPGWLQAELVPAKQAAWLDALRKASAIEKRIEAGDQDLMELAPAVDKEESSRQLHPIINVYIGGPSARPSSLLDHLQDLGIMMPMREFFETAGGGRLRHDEEQALPEAEGLMPGIFSRMLQHDDSGVATARENPEDEAGAVPKRVRDATSKASHGISFKRGPVVRRISITVLRGGGKPESMKKSASWSGAGETARIMAQRYADYQLDFLVKAAEKNDQELVSPLTILHNYLE